MENFIESSLSISIPLYSSSSTFPSQSKIAWDGLPPETLTSSLKTHCTSFSFFSPFIRTVILIVKVDLAEISSEEKAMKKNENPSLPLNVKWDTCLN